MLAARVVPVCRHYRHILCEYVDDTMYTTVIMNLPCQTILLTHLNLSIYVLGGSHAPWMVHWRFENNDWKSKRARDPSVCRHLLLGLL